MRSLLLSSLMIIGFLFISPIASRASDGVQPIVPVNAVHMPIVAEQAAVTPVRWRTGYYGPNWYGRYYTNYPRYRTYYWNQPYSYVYPRSVWPGPVYRYGYYGPYDYYYSARRPIYVY
jgi:hypothetical protein